jgi:diguanylate cyclase (GGDEF)-like protein
VPGVARLVVAQVGPRRAFARGWAQRKIAPFAVVAVLAELSSALPPGPRSANDIWVSLGLLAACAFAIRARWDRMPSALTVLVPLLFEASVLWLRLGQGGESTGVAIVGFIPLVWTALYQRRWESFVVVASIVFANVAVALLNKLPADVILRGTGLWALFGIVIALTVHDLRDRMDRTLARQQELTRRASAMNSAARALTSLLDVDAVVRRAVDLAVELVSSPQGARQRAHYDLIDGDQVRVQHQGDDGEYRFDTFALTEHPYLPSVVATMSPVRGTLSPERAGPNVSLQLEKAKVVCGAWVPVVVRGRLDGVLAMTSRAHDIGEDEFEQLQAVARLLELALANARAHELVQLQAMTDELTGLANHRSFEQLLEHRPGRQPFAVLAVDVDGLKLVNDSKGHAAGDELLRAIGQALVGTLRRGDILARVGGDEFAAFCFGADQVAVAEIAVRMFRALASVQVAGGPARISVGAACGGPIADARSVYSQADGAMYEAKRAGGMRLVSGAGPPVELADDVEGLVAATLTAGGPLALRPHKLLKWRST